VATAQADIENATAALLQAVVAQTRDTVAVDRANLTYAEQENTRYGDFTNRGSGRHDLANTDV
jgi:hypothetical protein